MRLCVLWQAGSTGHTIYIAELTYHMLQRVETVKNLCTRSLCWSTYYGMYHHYDTFTKSGLRSGCEVPIMTLHDIAGCRVFIFLAVAHLTMSGVKGTHVPNNMAG